MFDIPKSAFVKIIIYNSLGKEVTTLVNEKLSEERYEVIWDGTGFPSGVYFYRTIHSDKMITDDFINVKKMVLLK